MDRVSSRHEGLAAFWRPAPLARDNIFIYFYFNSTLGFPVYEVAVDLWSEKPIFLKLLGKSVVIQQLCSPQQLKTLCYILIWEAQMGSLNH